MLKKITLLSCLLLTGLFAQAQVTLTAPDTCANAHDPVVVAITGSNLDTLGSIGFELSYNTDILKVDSAVGGSGLSGLVNTNVSTPGTVLFSWLGPTSGQSLSDGDTIALVFFQLKSSVFNGQVSPLTFEDAEATLINQTTNIPTIVDPVLEDGSITVNCLNFINPNGLLTLIAVGDTVTCDDTTTYTVDILVDSFVDLSGLQFTLAYDTAALSFEMVSNLAPLPGLDTSDFSSFPNEGKITFAWFENSNNTLPDSSVLFSLSFERKGAPLTVSFVDDPTPIEASVGFLEIDVNTQNGTGLVIDSVPPSITCPNNVFLVNPMLLPALQVNNIAPLSVSDNCGTPGVTYTLTGATSGNGTGDASGTFFNKGTTTVTYTATDGAGLTDTCSFLVMVQDTFTLIAQGGAAQCGGKFVADIVVENFIDLRGVQFSVTWDSSILVYDTVTTNLPPTVGVGEIAADTLTFTWFDNDDTGETYMNGFAIFSIHFDVVGEVDSTTRFCIIGQPTPLEASYNGGALPVKIPVRTEKGFITVVDTLPPLPPTPPADTTVQCATDIPPGQDLTANFACAGTQTVSPTDSIVMGSCTNDLTLFRMWTFVGTGGNEITVTQIITVKDTIPPAPLFAVPQDTTVECDNIPPFFIPTTNDLTDNCSPSDSIQIVTTSSIAMGSCPNESIITRNWSFTDECGNTLSASQVITVIDTTPPTPLFAVPQDVTVECDSVPPFFMPTTSDLEDNCSPSDSIDIDIASSITPGSCANEFTITRSWTFTDQCDNAITATQVITVEDNTAPVLNVPADVTIECGESTDPSNTGNATATDNCSDPADIEIVSSDAFSPNCGNTGTITRTFTATDECGQVASDVQIITIEDTQAPTAVCQDVTVQLNNNGEGTVTAQELDGGSSDACSNTLSFASSPNLFGCDDKGPNTVTLSVTDECGNTGTCTATATVEDNIPPMLDCPNDITINLDPGACDAIVDFDITATDNCPFTFTINGFTADFAPTEWFTFINSDDGNVDVSGAPNSVTLTGANDGTGNARTDLCIVVPRDGEMTFTWSYSSANTSSFWDPFGYSINGVFTQLTANGGGALLNQTGTLTIDLNEGDEFCFSQRSVDGVLGAGTTTISGFSYVTTINMGEPLQTLGLPSGSFFEIGTTTNVFEISDDAGNTAVCEFDVVVKEFPNPLPSLVCNDQVNLSLDADCEEVIGADLILEGGPYGCYDEYIVTIVDESGTQIGNIVTGDQVGQILTVTVTDTATGTSCMGLLKVEDKIPPIITCSDVTVDCDDPTDPSSIPGTAQPFTFSYNGPQQDIIDGCDKGILEIPINVDDIGQITDIDLALEINHSWVGDLSVELEAPNGMRALLFERPGSDDEKCFDSFAQNGNNGDFGCSQDGIDTRFDDQATLTAEDFENLCLSGMNGTYQPLNKLAVFNGMDGAGVWKLRIIDAVNSGVQTGSFIGATLQITAGAVGAPIATDACGGVDLDFFDLEEIGDCSDPFVKQIFRNWTATDQSGNTATCVQTITVSRPTLADITLPPNLDDIDAPSVACDNPCTEPEYFPGDPCFVPGAPFGGGTGTPGGVQCDNISAYYEDVSLPVCENSFKILREWTILEWCTGESTTHTQIIKVGDNVGPTIDCPDGPIAISADNNCVGNFFVSPVFFDIKDNCSSNFSFQVRDPSTGMVFNQGSILGNLELGFHNFEAIAIDDCGNQTTCNFTISVVDLNPPIAICDEQTSVGLGNLVYDVLPFPVGPDANAELCFNVIDDGSFDNCGIEAIRLRRMDGRLGSDVFKECVYFDCADLGDTIMVQMRVYDRVGNFSVNEPNGQVGQNGQPIGAQYNECMVEIEVTDKINPVVACPPGINLDCWEYDPLDINGVIPDDGNPTTPPAFLIINTFKPQQPPQVQRIGYIGDYPGAFDNCAVDSVQIIVNENLDNCGEGTITRIFRAFEPIDPGENTPDFGQCIQIITVNNTDFFDICDTECWNTFAGGCATGHSLDDGVEWPCDIDLFGCGLGLEPEELDLNPDVDSFDVRPRIFDDFCDLVGVDYKDTYLTISTGCIKVIREWIVVDWCQPDPSFDLGYVTWTYTQEINVLESDPPVFDNCQDITLCNFTEDCQPEAQSTNDSPLRVNGTDDCTIASQLNYYYYFDAFNDGGPLPGGYDFNSDIPFQDGDNRVGDPPFPTPNPPFPFDTMFHDDNPDTRQVIEGKFPFGEHRVLWKIEDGCGNVTTCEILFTVKDCKKPTPVCVPLETVVMPSSQEVPLLARFFDQASFDNCTASEDLIFAYSDQIIGFTPAGQPLYDTVRVFTCDDLGENDVEIWVLDEAGNWEFCVTTVDVEDPNDVCSTAPVAQVSGAISTDYDVPVGKVDVSLNNMNGSGTMKNMLTGADGLYSFTAPLGNNYSILPEKNINHKNGVSTYDLVLISQHILGVAPFDSPYKYIAADANHDEKVTALDILELRKIVLQITEELPDNTSWRFVDKAYVFPNPKNPFNPPFPEVIDINNLQVDELDNDFVGVKIGDVDYSANSADFYREGSMVLAVQDRPVVKGEQVTVAFEADQFDQYQGYQFTLEVAPELAKVDAVNAAALPNLTADNFGLTMLEEGAITTSWNGNRVALEDGTGLFTVTLTATQNTRLSDILQVSSRFTQAEAYTADYARQRVALRFYDEAGSRLSGQPFELYQNQPNPFKSETVIGFNLPEASRATLTIFDVSGKVLQVIEKDYVQGYNMETIQRNMLPASGVLYYQLDAGEHTATRKMVLID